MSGTTPITGNTIRIPMSRRKLAIVTVLSFLFVLAGLYLIFLRPEEPDRPRAGSVLLGSITVAFFGLCLAYFIVRLCRPGMALEITAEGVVDRSSGLAGERLAWSEIEAIAVHRFLGQKMLGVYPRDLEAILARLPAWKRPLLRANTGLGAPPINIPESVLPISAEALLESIIETFGTPWLPEPDDALDHHRGRPDHI